MASMNTIVMTRHMIRHGTSENVGSAELQRQHDADPRLLRDAGEIRPAESDCRQIADGDADQHRHVLQKASGELDDQQDHAEHQGGDAR